MQNGKLALGMIETYGLPALIAAADAAAKTADVRIRTREKADAGIVIIYIEGDVSSVKAAVEAGEEAARRVGTLRGAHVIPSPDDSVPGVIKKWSGGTEPAGKQGSSSGGGRGRGRSRNAGKE
jgi:ethanolamine utilization protein EutM